MKKTSLAFFVLLLVLAGCSLQSKPLAGSSVPGSSAPVTDNRTLTEQGQTWPEEDFLVPYVVATFDFTTPGTYQWKNEFQDAAATVYLIGGGGGGGGSGSNKSTTSTKNASGGGGGGASGAKPQYKGNYGGAGGSGRVLIQVHIQAKAYGLRNRWTLQSLAHAQDNYDVDIAIMVLSSCYRAPTAIIWIEEPIAGSEAVRLKSSTSGKYLLYDPENPGKVSCGAIPTEAQNAEWYLDDHDGYTRIRNAAGGGVMNLENQGIVIPENNNWRCAELTAVPEQNISSHWRLVPPSESCFFYSLINRQTGDYLQPGTNDDFAYCISSTEEIPRTLFMIQESGITNIIGINGYPLNVEIRDQIARFSLPPPGSSTACWELEESDGFIRLMNAQTGEYLYDEEGSDVAKYSLTPPTLESSQWELVINVIY
ncbi:MAG: hypothetical protein EHM28_12140 [Spirochaetaceae bacterium]|nr:MAG: hypothetical protein EHM28_12140 [Spirochaetaceae bacterium]